jgi:hypothetical protein
MPTMRKRPRASVVSRRAPIPTVAPSIGAPWRSRTVPMRAPEHRRDAACLSISAMSTAEGTSGTTPSRRASVKMPSSSLSFRPRKSAIVRTWARTRASAHCGVTTTTWRSAAIDRQRRTSATEANDETAGWIVSTDVRRRSNTEYAPMPSRARAVTGPMPSITESGVVEGIAIVAKRYIARNKSRQDHAPPTRRRLIEPEEARFTRAPAPPSRARASAARDAAARRSRRRSRSRPPPAPCASTARPRPRREDRAD